MVGSRFQHLSKKLGVTIATQASVDKLHWVVDTVTTWQGPVSVVVFVPDKEFDIAQLYISYLRLDNPYNVSVNECFLRSCFPGVRDRVAWSLVHPLNLPPRAANIRDERMSCSDHRGLLDKLVRSVHHGNLSGTRRTLELGAKISCFGKI